MWGKVGRPDKTQKRRTTLHAMTNVITAK